MSKGALLELAARVEAATGADRELDARIDAVLAEADFDALLEQGVHARDWNAPAYTAALDAAMTLVPEGWRLSALEQDWRSSLWRAQLSRKPSAVLVEAFDAGRTIGWETAEAGDNGQATIATPALALTAAALRARATSSGDAPNQSGKEG